MIARSVIEQKAVSEIEALALDHGLLDPAIADHDKRVSYDGSITGYKKVDQDFKKEDWEFSVPVQVKGHIDNKNERTAKFIRRPVDLTDIRIYFRGHGVLYFQVLFDRDCKNAVIFYANLTPSKAKVYLDEAEKRKNKASIMVKFNRLKKNTDALYSALKQFDHDSNKQGRPIVEDTLRIEDADNVREISASIFGVRNDIEAMMKIADGEVALFGKVQGNPYEIPIELGPNYQFGAERIVSDPITIEGRIFYDCYKARVTSGKTFSIFPSKNIEMCMTSGDVTMRFKTDLTTLYHDASFLTEYIKKSKVSIGQNHFTVNTNVPDDSMRQFKYIIDAFETLYSIDVDTSFLLSELSEEDRLALSYLVDLRNGIYNDSISDELTKYLWSFKGKYIPVFIKKHKDGTIELINALFSAEKRAITTRFDEDSDEPYTLPVFVYCNAETLANLYKYDYDSLYAQIDLATISEKTLDRLNFEVLKLIQVYDINGDEHFLKLADYLSQKIENVLHHEHFIMNRLQIRKRLGVWGDKEAAELNEISSNANDTMFGKSVLQGNKIAADKYYGLMSAEEQEAYREFPIFTLYSKL